MEEEEEALRQGIVDKLVARAPEATICPSDVARELGEPDTWRDLMPAVREAARQLVERGAVEITQKGEVVDLPEVRGPIRIRRGPQWDTWRNKQ